MLRSSLRCLAQRPFLSYARLSTHAPNIPIQTLVTSHDCVYSSSLLPTLRNLKRVSFTTSLLSISMLAIPLLVEAPIGKTLALATAATFGVFTTFALNRFTNSYVTRIWTPRGNEYIVLQTLSLIGKEINHFIPYNSQTFQPLKNNPMRNFRSVISKENYNLIMKKNGFENFINDKLIQDWFVSPEILQEPRLKFLADAIFEEDEMGESKEIEINEKNEKIERNEKNEKIEN